MSNITQELKITIVSKYASKIAELSGEDKTSIKKIIDRLVPAIVVGLIKQSENNYSFNQIFNAFSNGNNASVLRFTNIKTAKKSSIIDAPPVLANTFLGSIFETNAANMLESVISSVRIKRESYAFILNVISAVTIDFFAKKIRHYHLDIVKFKNLIRKEKRNINTYLLPEMAKFAEFSASKTRFKTRSN